MFHFLKLVGSGSFSACDTMLFWYWSSRLKSPSGLRNTSLWFELWSISFARELLGTGNSSFSTSSDAFVKSTHVFDIFLIFFGWLFYYLNIRSFYFWLSPKIICNLKGFPICFLGLSVSSWARCNRFSKINRLADSVSSLFMRPCLSYVCKIDLTVESILFSTTAISRTGIRWVFARWIIWSRSSKDRTLLGCWSELYLTSNDFYVVFTFGDVIWMSSSFRSKLVSTRGRNPSPSFFIYSLPEFWPRTFSRSTSFKDFLTSYDLPNYEGLVEVISKLS